MMRSGGMAENGRRWGTGAAWIARAAAALSVWTMIALLTIAAAGAREPGRDEPAQLPDYWSESRFLVDTPGASSSLGAGLFNPAAWPMRGRGGFLFAWDDPAEDLPGACACSPRQTGEWLGVLSLRNLSFGMRSFLYERPDGEGIHWDEYTLGLGGGARGYAWGLGYAWSRADKDLAARHERLTLGSICRSRPLSFGLATSWDTKADEALVQTDIGVRPFGPRLTLFADATFDAASRWDDLGTRRWRTGYGLEAHPLRGVVLGAKALNTGEVSVRLSVGIAGSAQPSAAVHLDADGEHAATTYAYETEMPRPDMGIFRPRAVYPELDLRGPISYQRYRWFDHRRTLLGTLSQIDAYTANPAVAGVVLNLSGLQMDAETIWEVREQLATLRASGKRVVVYFDRAGLAGYLLASVADQVWIDPTGDLDITGLNAGKTYLRGTLDKLGLGVDEWRFFTYKSAFETLSRESMSEADREQIDTLLGDVYEYGVASITAARSLTRDAWDRLVREKGQLLPADALAAGLVDSIGTYEQAKQAVRKAPARAGGDALVSPLATLAGDPVWEPLSWGEPQRIALLYAIGACDMEQGIRGRVLSEKIRAAGDDRAVKAIVLRVDSPGGDALPSDLVAREMKAAAKKKPLIVSQGRVAGSGGYWISMFADSILAAPVTITGSIGVIGGWIWDNGLGEKLGIGYDHVQRGEHADLGGGMTLPLLGAQVPERPLTAPERARMEEMIRTMYAEFVGKVAEGRGLSREAVDQVGQGRIWSGTRGKEQGLVDEIGGLWRSLLIAKAAAGIGNDRAISLSEGPDLGLFNFQMPQMKLFGLLGGARGAGSEAGRDGGLDAGLAAGLAAFPANDAAAAASVLTPPVRLFLQRLALSRGRPLLMLEPFEIRDGVQTW
jgi:protease IV